MADISEKELTKKIAEILKDADLTTMSAKKVRQQLEEDLDTDLSEKKNLIKELVTNYVNSKEDAENDDEESEEEESEEEEETKKKPNTKRPAPPPKKAAKKSKKDESEDGSQSDEEASKSGGSDESDDDAYKPKKTPAKKKGGSKKKKGSDSDSDSDWGKKEPKKGAKTGRGKNSGYTRIYKLSPALAELMGEESMRRHEVVKRVWAIIKERKLYDETNRQFAICDDDLYKVFGTKRFRTFGMMKYLKTHFHE